METLQDRLDAISRKRKINGKEIGKLLLDSYQGLIDENTPFFNGDQFNKTVEKITGDENRRNYTLYRQLYMEIVQLRNKGLALKNQFTTSLNALAMVLNELLTEQERRDELLNSPIIYSNDEFEELRKQARETMENDKEYTLETILEGFLDAMDGALYITIPHDIYNELLRLKGLTGAGSRHEAELHKNLYRLKGGAESDTFDITSSDNPFITALVISGVVKQAEDAGKLELKEIEKEIQTVELKLLYQGGDAIKRYCKLKTKTKLNIENKELENTLEELIELGDQYDYIYSNKQLRKIQNALGLFPQVEYIGKSDEYKRDSSLYDTLRYCISDSRAGKFAISQALRIEYPELLKLLRDYIKDNLNRVLYRLINDDENNLDDYFLVRLSKSENRFSIDRVKYAGIAILRDIKRKDQRKTISLPEDNFKDYLNGKAPHAIINYSSFYSTIAFINSYNVLLELIDKAFSTHLSSFAKLDLGLYDDRRDLYNATISLVYFRLKATYSGEELEKRRGDIKHTLNFQYMKDAREITPTREAVSSVGEHLQTIVKNVDADGKILMLETFFLSPLVNSCDITGSV